MSQIINGSQPMLGELPQQQIRRIKGYYRLTGLLAQLDHYGRPWWQVRLSDCTGTLVASFQQISVTMPAGTEQMVLQYGVLPEGIRHGGMVQVEAVISYDDAVPTGTLVWLTPVLESECALVLAQQPILASLPRCLCPRPALLDQLLLRVRDLRSPLLQRFVSMVLEQAHVAAGFISVPASHRYHHTFGGGLLAHSLEIVDTLLALPSLNEQEREIAVVAGLLHDLGKAWTLTAEGETTALGYMVAHEHLTLELCAPALMWLDQEWPEAALALRHILTSIAPGMRFSYQPVLAIVHAVRMADKLSAEQDRNKVWPSLSLPAFKLNSYPQPKTANG